MTYLWVKAAHIVAVITWMGGMLVTGAIMPSIRNAPKPLPRQVADVLLALREWDRRVTSPAMLLTWLLGLTLATWGGWFPARWLQAKLAVVLALSAVHGAQAGALRRLAGGTHDAWPRALSAAVLAALAAVVALVVVKPF